MARIREVPSTRPARVQLLLRPRHAHRPGCRSGPGSQLGRTPVWRSAVVRRPTGVSLEPLVGQYVASDYQQARPPGCRLRWQSIGLSETRSSIASFAPRCLSTCGIPQRVPQEICRVLRRNGVALVTVPLNSGIHMAPNDYCRFTEFGLRELCDRVGLVAERHRRAWRANSHRRPVRSARVRSRPHALSSLGRCRCAPGHSIAFLACPPVGPSLRPSVPEAREPSGICPTRTKALRPPENSLAAAVDGRRAVADRAHSARDPGPCRHRQGPTPSSADGTPIGSGGCAARLQLSGGWTHVRSGRAPARPA